MEPLLSVNDRFFIIDRAIYASLQFINAGLRGYLGGLVSIILINIFEIFSFLVFFNVFF